MKRATHALDFWELFVVPDYRDYVSQNNNPRRAFHTALSMDHLREYVLKTNGLPSRPWLSSEKLYTAHLVEVQPRYQPIMDFSNLLKHKSRDRALAYISIDHGSPAGLIFKFGKQIEKSYLAEPIIIKMKNGTRLDFVDAAEDVFEMWKSELRSLWPDDDRIRDDWLRYNLDPKNYHDL